MPNNHTKFRAEFEENPLEFGMDCRIVDHDGHVIDLIGATPDLTHRIARSLNYHHRLVDTIEYLLDMHPSNGKYHDCTDNGFAECEYCVGRKLLKDLEKQE